MLEQDERWASVVALTKAEGKQKANERGADIGDVSDAESEDGQLLVEQLSGLERKVSSSGLSTRAEANNRSCFRWTHCTRSRTLPPR